MNVDFFYPFHFDTQPGEAIKRLRASIGSVVNQGVNVCVANTSKMCIYKYISDMGKIKYIHKATNNDYCKPLTINFGVKNLVETEYFFTSDIDLVYQNNHVNCMLDIAENEGVPVRIIHKNYNISYASYSSDYMDHMQRPGIMDPSGRPWSGYAHGNGLIHTHSFIKVRGYDEFFYGYAPEDDEFNQRVGKVSKLIYTNDENVATAHIFHTRSSADTMQHQINMHYYQDKLNHINNKQSMDTLTLEDIQANTNKEWGNI